MDFGEILAKAWKIIWKHKILWLFGFLASCGAARSYGGGGGAGGGGNAMYSNGQQSFHNGFDFLSPSSQRAIEDFFQSLVDIPSDVWIGIGIAVLLVIIAIFFVLFFIAIVMTILSLMAGTLGQIGVIKGTSLADEAEAEAKPLSFKNIFNAIKKHFWKVLLFILGWRIAGFVLVLFLFIPLILFTACTCGLGLFLLIPIGWFIKVLFTFSTIAMVEEDRGVFKGIERGWQVLTQNLGNVLLMFLILGIGQFIVGLLIALPLILVPVPLLINLFATGFQMFTVGLILSGLLFIAYLPLMIFLVGVLTAYVLSCWTLTFRRLTSAKALEPQVLSVETDEEETT